MQTTTGKLPVVFPLSIQDVTPYGNDVYHINSILQPATATKAPVVGIAITTETAVPGCATGASNPFDLEQTGRFVLAVAKEFGRGGCKLYDEAEFNHLLDLYGSLQHFETLGRTQISE